jgi:hypothetical protein
MQIKQISIIQSVFLGVILLLCVKGVFNLYEAEECDVRWTYGKVHGIALAIVQFQWWALVYDPCSEDGLSGSDIVSTCPPGILGS